MNVYLDYAATTPLEPLVLQAMLPALNADYGNPASLHRAGQRVRSAVETAREQVASAIHAQPREVTFTSGATEADNHALRAYASQFPGGHIVTSLLEHAAVLSTCRYLETQGWRVTYLKPNVRGEITVNAVQEALQPDTFLVALDARQQRNRRCYRRSGHQSKWFTRRARFFFATRCRRSA